MNKQKEQILAYFSINADTNISIIIEDIERTLTKLKNKTIAKRIVLCSIELIQNNIIHNNKSSEILISETENTIILKLSQSIFVNDAQKILKIINSINQLSTDELKTIYKKNLAGDTKTTGNGLISCRIKSENIIEFNITKSHLCETILKFNKL